MPASLDLPTGIQCKACPVPGSCQAVKVLLKSLEELLAIP